jgi:hypothetical protein
LYLTRTEEKNGVSGLSSIPNFGKDAKAICNRLLQLDNNIIGLLICAIAAYNWLGFYNGVVQLITRRERRWPRGAATQAATKKKLDGANEITKQTQFDWDRRQNAVRCLAG